MVTRKYGYIDVAEVAEDGGSGGQQYSAARIPYLVSINTLAHNFGQYLVHGVPPWAGFGYLQSGSL
jgi:hypothetical protein